MKLIDFKQYLTCYISVTLKDATIHAGFVSNPEAFYALPNDAAIIPDVRLMNGLMLDIIAFDDIDFVQEAEREDTVSLKMITDQVNNAATEKEYEETDFQKMMDSLRRLVVKGKQQKPVIEKAILISKPFYPVQTIARQQLLLDSKGNIQVFSYHQVTETTDFQTATIDEEDASSILSLLYDCDSYQPVSRKEGSFKLSLSIHNYAPVKVYGPLNNSVSANGTLLSPYLQEKIPLEPLLLFG